MQADVGMKHCFEMTPTSSGGIISFACTSSSNLSTEAAEQLRCANFLLHRPLETDVARKGTTSGTYKYKQWLAAELPQMIVHNFQPEGRIQIGE